jgi:glycerol dehydrogenase-like iron-containing ADH family enzyme
LAEKRRYDIQRVKDELDSLKLNNKDNELAMTKNQLRESLSANEKLRQEVVELNQQIENNKQTLKGALDKVGNLEADVKRFRDQAQEQKELY